MQDSSRPRLIAIAFFTFALFTAAHSQTGEVIDTGKFILHKFQQPIGEETYEIRRMGSDLKATSDFKFVDRGSPVPLSTTLTTASDLTPRNFTIHGNTARGSTIDDEITITGATANIREGKEMRQASVPAQFFTIAGYAPATLQMMMMRYRSQHNVNGPLPTLPNGTVTVEDRGKDVVSIDGKQRELERYIVSGLIWGRESLWMDKEGNLAALIGVDAEFDHFEALRDGYESQLNFFISKGAEDGMAALSELSNSLSPQRTGSLVITNVTLIDGTGKAPVTGAAVLVENGKISAVGSARSIKKPREAQVIDGKGKYLLPGLWDMHAHFEQVEWGPVYLAAGVTTVRDVGNELDFIKSVRDAIQQGRGLGPRMLLAGIVDGDSPVALGVSRVNTPEEGRAWVHRYHEAGFQQMKIYSSVKLDVLRAITAEAHKLGMTVTGHIPNGITTHEAIEAGQDQINHIQYLPQLLLPNDYKRQRGVVPKIDFNSEAAKAGIQFLKDHHTVIDPTMVVFEWFGHPSNVPMATFEPGAAKLPPELYAPINNTGVPPERVEQSTANINSYLEIIGALHKAGIPIVVGTDQVVPGHSVHREMELYVKAGFTPMEAIQAATIVPARVMKVDNEIGSIEPGKVADMILVDGDPLQDIANLRKVNSVITGGRVFDPAKLWTSVGFKP